MIGKRIFNFNRPNDKYRSTQRVKFLDDWNNGLSMRRWFAQLTGSNGSKGSVRWLKLMHMRHYWATTTVLAALNKIKLGFLLVAIATRHGWLKAAGVGGWIMAPRGGSSPLAAYPTSPSRGVTRQSELMHARFRELGTVHVLYAYAYAYAYAYLYAPWNPRRFRRFDFKVDPEQE